MLLGNFYIKLLESVTENVSFFIKSEEKCTLPFDGQTISGDTLFFDNYYLVFVISFLITD